MSKPVTLDEIDTIYVSPQDRYVVALIVGYTVEDLAGDDMDRWVEMSSEEQAREAARWALDLTRDEGAIGTQWFVYDRHEKVKWQFEQREFDPEMDGALIVGPPTVHWPEDIWSVDTSKEPSDADQG